MASLSQEVIFLAELNQSNARKINCYILGLNTNVHHPCKNNCALPLKLVISQLFRVVWRYSQNEIFLVILSTVSLAFRDPHGQQSCQVGACAMIPALVCCRA